MADMTEVMNGVPQATMPLEGPDRLTGFQEALGDFAGRIARGLRNGYEAVNEALSEIPMRYKVFGAAAMASFAIGHGEAVAATPDSVTGAQQGCDTALDEPTIVHPLRMSQAGIRPYTGWRHSQAVTGSFEYPNVACSAENETRVASGRVQSFRNGHWGPIWGQSVGSWTENDGGVSRIIAQPGHADPGYGYLFNDCAPGQGFHPVRIVLDLMLKEDGDPTVVAGKKEYIFRLPVKGNCNAAHQSKQIAEKQMKHNYGTQ